MNPDIQKRLVNQVFNQVERDYAQAQRDEAVKLHNQLASIIGEVKPSPESLLLVLELLKQEVLGNLIEKMEGIKTASRSGGAVG